jgi:U3 small nucleolar RNA-associated protein 5
LSGLHATLTSRLALQASLLSLSGRLDMVLSQIELRSSNTPAQVMTTSKSKQAKPRNQFVMRYVEGESDQEDEIEVEVENDDDGGSVEDIEFGKGQNDTEDDDEGSDESSDDEDGPMPNGFIDDEAEEQFDDDESDDISE